MMTSTRIVSEASDSLKDWVRTGLEGSEAMLNPRNLPEKNKVERILVDTAAPEFRDRRRSRAS